MVGLFSAAIRKSKMTLRLECAQFFVLRGALGIITVKGR